jgi:putative flippase GtrA
MGIRGQLRQRDAKGDVMAYVRTGSVRRGVLDQAARFVLFGVLSACVDFGVYQLLLHAGLPAYGAKAISFVCGTVTAYLLNRRWTFDAEGGTATALRFAALYSVTFFVNVGVNSLGLHVFTGNRWQVPLAWVIAQGTATVINFVLLRTVVFRDAAQFEGDTQFEGEVAFSTPPPPDPAAVLGSTQDPLTKTNSSPPPEGGQRSGTGSVED